MRKPVRIDFLLLFAVLFLVFLYGPVLLLPAFSFNDSIYISLPFTGFTFDWYRQMLANTALVEALKNSLKLGLVVSLVSTLLGGLAAKAVTRQRLPGKAPATALIMLPMVIPPIIIGIALLVLALRVFGLPLSLWTIGAGHVLLCAPFAMLIMTSRLEGFDRSLEEASTDLGEGSFATFWRVTLPLALPGIVASLLLCLTVSFDEFVLAFFLGGNETTLPIFIFSQLRFPNRLPEVLALGSCILVFSFAVVTFSELFRRR